MPKYRMNKKFAGITKSTTTTEEFEADNDAEAIRVYAKASSDLSEFNDGLGIDTVDGLWRVDVVEQVTKLA